MFIKKNYKARHKILKILFQHNINFKPSDSLENVSLHFDEICKQLPQYSRPFLLDNLDYLRTTKEIYCSMKFDNSTFAIFSDGNHAYRDKKYIREGIKEQVNYIYDIAKTVSVVVLLVIAIWTFAQNIYQTRQNKSDIEKLRKELQETNKKFQQLVPATNNKH